jgi:hypothetical protein
VVGVAYGMVSDGRLGLGLGSEVIGIDCGNELSRGMFPLCGIEV